MTIGEEVLQGINGLLDSNEKNPQAIVISLSNHSMWIEWSLSRLEIVWCVVFQRLLGFLSQLGSWVALRCFLFLALAF